MTKTSFDTHPKRNDGTICIIKELAAAKKIIEIDNDDISELAKLSLINILQRVLAVLTDTDPSNDKTACRMLNSAMLSLIFTSAA